MAGVRTYHPDYIAFQTRWQRARDVIGGEAAMHAAKTLYLPQLRDESGNDYAARLARSDFFNASWRTIDGLGGMAFRKPPTVHVPAAIEDMLEDVDGAGMSIAAFAKECVEEVLGVGRIGILVDHPTAPENVSPITVAAAQAMGLRPTLQLYPTETIRNWKFARINNAWVLTQVVLQFTEMVAKDEFESEAQDRYRVLDLGGPNDCYRQRAFFINKRGDDEQIGGDVIPLMDGKPLSYIPFAWAGVAGRNDALDDPPLIDLIDKNVAHYQVNSDYRHGLHFTALPTPYVCGFQDDGSNKNFYIGSQAAWVFTDPNTKVGYLEFHGAGLKTIEAELTRLETQMAILGARLISDETKGGQVETLGATQIKRQGENGVLAKIVQSISETIEWALTIFAKWAGAGGAEIEFDINRDFVPVLIDGRELMALVTAVQAGALSDQEFFDLMQRGDVIAGDKTFEQHKEEIASQGPAKPEAVTAGAGAGKGAPSEANERGIMTGAA